MNPDRDKQSMPNIKIYAPTNEVAKNNMGRNAKNVAAPAANAIPPKKHDLPMSYIYIIQINIFLKTMCV